MPALISNQEALYRTMHNTSTGYRGNNQGVSRLRYWLNRLPEPPASILEIGCGNGALCQVLNMMGYDVTGLDIVGGQYKREGYRFVKHDIQLGYLPFKDNEFDYCVSFDVLEHLPQKWIEQHIWDMLRVSIDGIIGTVACYGTPKKLLHISVHPPEWWKENISRLSEKEMEYLIITSMIGNETLLFKTKKEEGELK